MIACVVVEGKTGIAIASDSLAAFNDAWLPNAYEENHRIFHISYPDRGMAQTE
jgi:hypothetical protein